MVWARLGQTTAATPRQSSLLTAYWSEHAHRLLLSQDRPSDEPTPYQVHKPCAEAKLVPSQASTARVAATLQEQSVAERREKLRKADQIIMLALNKVGRSGHLLPLLKNMHILC